MLKYAVVSVVSQALRFPETTPFGLFFVFVLGFFLILDCLAERGGGGLRFDGSMGRSSSS